MNYNAEWNQRQLYEYTMLHIIFSKSQLKCTKAVKIREISIYTKRIFELKVDKYTVNTEIVHKSAGKAVTGGIMNKD